MTGEWLEELDTDEETYKAKLQPWKSYTCR